MPVNLLNEKDLNNYLTDIVYHGQAMEVFKSGDFRSTAFVEQNKDAIVRSMLLHWCKHRLRSHLAEDLPEHREFLKPINADEPDLPTWTQHCLSQGNPIHRFMPDNISPKLTEKIGMICDYLYASAESYVNKTLIRVKDTNTKSKEELTPKLRIDYLKTQDIYDTFAKTLAEAEKWHKIMAQKAELRQRDGAMYQASLAGTHSIMKLQDGMEIVQLTTPEALDYESEYMGHCVGKGNYDKGVKEGTTKIYSLRDADGMPHATFEVRINKDTKKEEIYQCKGKGDKAPVEKYRPYVQEFIKAKDFDIVGDQIKIGLIKLYSSKTRKTQYYDIYNIPKNQKFVCKGDLNLSETELTELPDLSNIIVKGNFNCAHNRLTTLKGAPLKIYGNFICSCNKLISLIGAPQKVGGNFMCTGNKLTTLEHAPRIIGGSLSCAYNKIKSFTDSSLIIGKDLLCYGNEFSSLQMVPKCTKIICDTSVAEKYNAGQFGHINYPDLIRCTAYKTEKKQTKISAKEQSENLQTFSDNNASTGITNIDTPKPIARTTHLLAQIKKRLTR